METPMTIAGALTPEQQVEELLKRLPELNPRYAEMARRLVRKEPDKAVHILTQFEFMLSPFNKWIAGEKCCHPPSPEDAAQHFTNSPGAADFRQQHPEP